MKNLEQQKNIRMSIFTKVFSIKELAFFSLSCPLKISHADKILSVLQKEKKKKHAFVRELYRMILDLKAGKVS